MLIIFRDALCHLSPAYISHKNCEYVQCSVHVHALGVRCHDVFSRRHCWFGNAKNDESLSLTVLRLQTWCLRVVHVNIVTIAVYRHCHCPITVCNVSCFIVVFTLFTVHDTSQSLRSPRVDTWLTISYFLLLIMWVMSIIMIVKVLKVV